MKQNAKIIYIGRHYLSEYKSGSYQKRNLIDNDLINDSDNFSSHRKQT